MGFLDIIFGSPEKKEKKLREKLEYLENMCRSTTQELANLRERLSNATDEKEKKNIQQGILDCEEILRRCDTDMNHIKNKLSKLNPVMQAA